MNIFKALWAALTGTDGYQEQNKQVEESLQKESQGEDISPTE